MHTRLNQVLPLVLLLAPCLRASLCDEDCFYESPEMCAGTEPKCRVTETCDNTTVVCCYLNDINLSESLQNFTRPNGSQIQALHIQKSNFGNFTLAMVEWLKPLRSIAITNGRMNAFNPTWKKFTAVKCLNLSSNGLTQVGKLATPVHLRTLDLSKNGLSSVPDFRANLTSSNISIRIDMSDNKLSCDDLTKKLDQYKDNLDFINANSTWCQMGPDGKKWFNKTEMMMLSEVEKLTQLTCSVENCECAFQRLDVSKPEKGAKVWLRVDCSARGLQSLPKVLPENCVSLNVSHNNISSLDPIQDPSYAELRELYADHNNITSLDALEGSKFIQNFVLLDLRHNNIRTIKTHSLKDAFDRVTTKRELSLGQNYVECDCHAAKVLKNWLLLKEITDIEEIYCLDKPDVKVIHLDPSELCREKQSWTDYIYYIIAAEVLLLSSLIAKVSYDYWVFKSTGYLPWPASKIPKLPCDWLCE